MKAFSISSISVSRKNPSFRCPVPYEGLLFKGSQTGAYLTIEPYKGTSVPVAVWEVKEDDELSLDRYEGYPRFYYKAEMELSVISIDGSRVKRLPVFVYIIPSFTATNLKKVG